MSSVAKTKMRMNAKATRKKEELEEWREHLLRYCELDTFAMVKVLEKLREAAK